MMTFFFLYNSVKGQPRKVRRGKKMRKSTLNSLVLQLIAIYSLLTKLNSTEIKHNVLKVNFSASKYWKL